MRAAVLTISTSKANGLGRDESGPLLVELARRLDADDVTTALVPDDKEQIQARVRHFADEDRRELVLTTGGTGFASTDVTPEATRAVIEREAPGIAEAIRLAAREHTPFWMLSRGVAGIRGRTLIVNLPGNPKSIRESADVLVSALPHALALLAGERTGH